MEKAAALIEMVEANKAQLEAKAKADAKKVADNQAAPNQVVASSTSNSFAESKADIYAAQQLSLPVTFSSPIGNYSNRNDKSANFFISDDIGKCASIVIQSITIVIAETDKSKSAENRLYRIKFSSAVGVFL